MQLVLLVHNSWLFDEWLFECDVNVCSVLVVSFVSEISLVFPLFLAVSVCQVQSSFCDLFSFLLKNLMTS